MTTYRARLECHGVIQPRRADGGALDGMLHVNPQLTEKAMLVDFNPTIRDLKEESTVPLHCSGLTERATVPANGAPPRAMELDELRRARLTLEVPAGGFLWARFGAKP